MKHESGRSLIEMVGILAISGILAAGAFKMFQVIQMRTDRTITEDQLRDISNNAKILFSGRRSFDNISTSYMIKAGALKYDRLKIGGPITIQSISTTPRLDRGTSHNKSFEIKIPEVGFADCIYFATKKLGFTHSLKVNNFEQTLSSYCKDDYTNELSFIIRLIPTRHPGVDHTRHPGVGRGPLYNSIVMVGFNPTIQVINPPGIAQRSPAHNSHTQP
jgi:hypothetical protein